MRKDSFIEFGMSFHCRVVRVRATRAQGPAAEKTESPAASRDFMPPHPDPLPRWLLRGWLRQEARPRGRGRLSAPLSPTVEFEEAGTCFWPGVERRRGRG